MLDDLDFEETPDDEGPPPEESSNRSFLFIAGGLGVVLLLGVICIAGYAFLNRDTGEGTDPAVLTAEAQNAQISQQLTQTAIAAAFSPTPSNTAPPTATQAPATATSALAVTATPDGSGGGDGPTPDPRTATVQALLTQASVAQTQAANQIVTTTPTSTPVGALPDTGLLDDAGLPALAGLTMVLLVVIFAARRLRSANG
ncbi:MAG: hypothetical protein EPO32_14505 [Anaerolineae bacterium]|nr:MAG: hypothetical protein EPO32_14505 [Anaerolineae bacterium]